MAQIRFTKMVASGNDFIIIDNDTLPLAFTVYRLPGLAKRICDRRFGVGADGLLLIEKSKKADFKMRIFNPDGSEPQMCANGIRCVVLYKIKNRKSKIKNLKIETKAGMVEALVNRLNWIKIRMPKPKDLKARLNLKIDSDYLRLFYINSGVPHTIYFVKNFKKIDVESLGKKIRFHRYFQPQGTNVDFVRIIDAKNIEIRTYERGVEAETLACGTGAVAAAILTSYRLEATSKNYLVRVKTKSDDILKVYFEKIFDTIDNVYLEGKAEIVFEGEYKFKNH